MYLSITCVFTVCGRPEIFSSNIGRILGGKDAALGELPWQLLIKRPKRGGASLINDRWAVTAAHVVENVNENSLTLYGGLIDGKRESSSDVLQSERIIIHPSYLKGMEQRTNFDHDIALIRLSSRVNFRPNLLPICLPEARTPIIENMLGTVAGWGLTESKTKRLHTSQMLKYAHIGVYSLEDCQDTPSLSTNQRMIFTDNMFCAGKDGTDSCAQDSGGPFVSPMLAEGKEPFYLTGLVSWGSPCRERKYKGYYTKVGNYVDWIKQTIDEIEKSYAGER